MSDFIKTVCCLVLMLLASFSGTAQQNLPPWETPFVEGELIIMLSPGVSADAVLRYAATHDGKATGIKMAEVLSDGAGIYLFQFDHNKCDQYGLLERIRDMKEVVAAQFNHYVEQRLSPTDPQFGSQWHHIDASDNDIDTDLAWSTTTGGNTGDGHNVVACVVESGGINWSHTDLIANHWTNIHEVANDGIDNDLNGRVDDFDGWCSSCGNDNLPSASHGTACMGMMGAAANNGTGGAGVCWNTDLMAVAFSGSLTEANVIAAYDYPYDMRVQYNATNGALGAFVTVMSSSWGIDNANPASFPVWCAFYDTMGAAGILNCAATTNNNANVDVVGDMPTGCGSQYLISVTATNSSDVRTFSGYGVNSVDLAAPGEAVWIPNLTGYSSQSGTSFATPCVAGAVALMYSLPCANFGAQGISSPGATALLIKNAIFSGVDPVAGLSGFVGTGGRLNVNNSLNILAAGCGVSIPGCTDPTACNYNPLANTNDGSCTYGNIITVNMSDSYGDSWNGAAYQIYDAFGTLVASGSHVFGPSSSATHCLPTGCYTISVSAGDFPSEIGWSLSGIDGSLSGGAPVTDLPFSVGAPFGCTDIFACNYDPAACVSDGSCCYGTCATVTVSGGLFPSEISWTLVDPFGVAILSGGAPYNGTVCLNYSCLNYTVQMFDSYGDSWNGASFTLAQPGVWSASATHASGLTSSATLYAGINGCTDPFACNYNPLATCSDGSCSYGNPVTITMTDSYGDSWNGSQYEVYDSNGVLVASGTHAGGPSSSNILCLATGCYTITVTAGFFPSEIGWSLSGIDGTLSGGAPATGIPFTVGAPFGCTDPTACNYDFTACIDDGSCCYQNCLYLEEFDSFGDGWDNAVFNIYDYTGALVSSQTLEVAGGTYGVDLLCLPDGCYTYEVTSGFFPSEISWNLYYANEGTLSGTANQSGSFTVGSPTYGCTDPFACNYNFASNCDDGSCVYCPEYCLALDMTDSYGDGWNGAAYNVYNVYGALVASGTLDFFYGSNEIAGLCLGSGCYTLEVTSGSFPSEIGWTLYGANEGTLSGGASSNVSFSIGLPVIGCLDPFACNYNSDATCDDGNCVYCPEYCVSIDMADSFGDGWNGAGYAVYNANGIQIASGTLDFGYNYNEIEAICLPAGCYTLEVSAGSFPSEIGWTLNGANEGVLSGGASTTVSFTVGAPVYGCLDVAACNYNPAATCDDASCVYCLENCVAITMTDSYGDGWDGASYTVYSNDGLAVANGTLDFAYGGVEVEAICLPDGCYTMDVTGGSFPSEVGWTLNGTNESPISGGANTSIAFTVGTVVSGCTDAAAGNYNPAANCEDGSCTYGCFGDFDDNGVINVSDLLLFMANFGCTTACGEYDLDGNTVVNVNDLLLFMAIFGTVCP